MSLPFPLGLNLSRSHSSTIFQADPTTPYNKMDEFEQPRMEVNRVSGIIRSEDMNEDNGSKSSNNCSNDNPGTSIPSTPKWNERRKKKQKHYMGKLKWLSGSLTTDAAVERTRNMPRPKMPIPENSRLKEFDTSKPTKPTVRRRNILLDRLGSFLGCHCVDSLLGNVDDTIVFDDDSDLTAEISLLSALSESFSLSNTSNNGVEVVLH